MPSNIAAFPQDHQPDIAVVGAKGHVHANLVSRRITIYEITAPPF
jgi:hypothetical protein